jgi:SNF2 family DNA or RNA helicase
VFKDKDSFLEKFAVMTDAKQVNELHNLLKPYLLRRVKEDVEKVRRRARFVAIGRVAILV